jgi:hypothetical protein
VSGGSFGVGKEEGKKGRREEGNKQTKRNKKHLNWKEISKIFPDCRQHDPI